MPNRIIKESICTSEKISCLTDFEFRLWVGLLISVDDAGRGDARPAIIKGRVFPLRERVSIKDIDVALHGLAAKGCVSLYTVGGKPYFWFPTWTAHQRIRDSKPKYPSFDERDDFAASCGELRRVAANCGELPPESNPIQSEYESKSKGNRAAPTRRKHGRYENVLLSEEDFAKLQAEFPSDYQDRIERLSEYMASSGKVYKNHLATIRAWARKDKSQGTETGRKPHEGLGELEELAIRRMQGGDE